MTNFQEFREPINKQAEWLAKQDNLFLVDVDKDALWEMYLESFPFGNEIFRERTNHDCSACRQFVKQFGNVVAIDDNCDLVSVWDIEVPEPYQTVANELSDIVKSKPVVRPFSTTNARIGVCENRELKDGQVLLWTHMYVDVPRKFNVNDTVIGGRRTNKEVFKSSLEAITTEATETILELIAQNSLYRGQEWQGQLKAFLELQKEYEALPDNKKDNFCWLKSDNPVLSRIKNHAIGTLLVDVSEGKDLNEAVKSYGNKVDPTNYKHPKTIFSKVQVQKAEEFAKENGFFDSLQRRFATLDDISVNDILFRGEHVRLKDASPFSSLSTVESKKPSFDHVQEIGVDDFVENVLPIAQGLEVYFEGKHQKNLVSLTAPIHPNSKTMFKWDNKFAWSYNGDLADSAIKANVAKFGGDVSGVLRFSIQWNDNGDNNDDLDAHCSGSDGMHIYYGQKYDRWSGGNLDIDITNPNRQAVHNNGVAVENITFPSVNTMKDMVYHFYVKNYEYKYSNSGFTAEIEFDNQIHQFEHPAPLRQSEVVNVADVILRNGLFTLQEKLKSSISTREIWGIKTNEFHPVNLVMLSPNHWEQGNRTGNKHWFFLIDSCTNDGEPRGFFNEYLKEEFMEHKRVFEALGSQMRVQPSQEQLSGLGFSSTQESSIIVKVKGQTERLLKIKF